MVTYAVGVPVSLFLQSLPESFQTFWRFRLPLPVLAVIAIPLLLVAAFIPLVNLMVPSCRRCLQWCAQMTFYGRRGSAPCP